jgi:hypothetical protein
MMDKPFSVMTDNKAGMSSTASFNFLRDASMRDIRPLHHLETFSSAD